MRSTHIVGALILLIILGGMYLYLHRESDASRMAEVPTGAKLNGTPTFLWSYKTSTGGDIPQTEISLTAEYEDGGTVTKVIDTIEGDCNEYEDADADTYERSSMIICYYAGLGHYFKVVTDGAGYTVLRKIFEEASPEYDPPQQSYEAVASF